MKDDVRDFVTGVLLGGRSVADDEDLLLSGLVDSLGVMRLVDHLETQTGLTIPAHDVVIENFETIDAISAYLDKRRNA